MVTLSRIYTRTGDKGLTRLGDHSQVSKTDARLEAYGTVDELNALLGLALACGGLQADQVGLLQRLQNDLFDLGADLCKPCPEGEEDRALRISPAQVEWLEAQIDRLNEPLPPLRSFVLPGGTAGAAWLHLARTVCRRGERRAWELAQRARVNPQALVFLNRLSDLLFVMARAAAQGRESLWEPGRNLGSAQA